MQDALRRHPPFLTALVADTRFVSARWGRPIWDAPTPRVLVEAIRIAWQSDGFLAQVAWRLRARLLSLGVPMLPTLLHRFSMIWAQMSIGEAVVAQPGINIPHGQVTIGGFIEIGPEVVISPFVSIGLVTGDYRGPRLGRGVQVGTGVRILGPVRVGSGARIGANAVVLDDVPAGVTVAGVPARVLSSGAKPSC